MTKHDLRIYEKHYIMEADWSDASCVILKDGEPLVEKIKGNVTIKTVGDFQHKPKGCWLWIVESIYGRAMPGTCCPHCGCEDRAD